MNLVFCKVIKECQMTRVSKERLAELVKKAVKLAYDDSLSTDTLFTPEIMGATPDEFDVLVKFLNGIELKGRTNARS